MRIITGLAKGLQAENTEGDGYPPNLGPGEGILVQYSWK